MAEPNTMETYLQAWGLICIIYVPYVLFILRAVKKERDNYFEQWKSSVMKRRTK